MSRLIETFGILLALFVGLAVTNRKQFRLNFLSLNAFTGFEPRDNRLCKIAQQIAMDAINNRSDILPSYHIELDFQDEGAAGALAIKAGIEYTRRMEQLMATQSDDPVFQAPITMGPLVTAGCKGWGSTARYVNMVALAGSCQAASQTANRKLYPNMYRPRVAAETQLYARYHFLKAMTKWRRIGIFSVINTNPFNYEMPPISYSIATKAGFEVVAFESSPDYRDDILPRVKQLDLRLFAFDCGEAINAMKFLCQAFNNGITGSRYFFMFIQNTYLDPKLLPDVIQPGCTREIVMEQLNYSMFTGSPYDAVYKVAGKSELGHSLDDFEALFDRYSNSARTADYDTRHMCYDRILQAAITLNDSENALAKLNLTLRDYSKYPELVMKVVNKSAAEVDFRDLRHGRFRYSNRLEVDYEPQLITKWTPERGLFFTHIVVCRFNASPTDINSYYIEKIDGTPWYFPSDSGIKVDVVLEVPTGAFGAITSVAGATALLQLVLVSLTMFNKEEDEGNQAFLISTTKRILVIGCLFLDATAITVSVTSRLLQPSACVIRILFGAIGLSLSNTSLAVVQYHFGVEARIKGSNQRSQQTNQASTTLSSRPLSKRVFSKPDSIGASSNSPSAVSSSQQQPSSGFANPVRALMNLPIALAFSTCTQVLIVCVMVSVDPFNIKKEYLGTDYDFASDIYFDKWTYVCKSHDGASLIAALLVLNALPLVIGLVGAVKRMNNSGNEAAKQCQVTLVMTSTLFVGTIAAAFVEDSRVNQHLIVAVGLILNSIAITAIMFQSTFKRYSTRFLGRGQN